MNDHQTASVDAQPEFPEESQISLEEATKIVFDGVELLQPVVGVEAILHKGEIKVETENHAFHVDVRLDEAPSLSERYGGVWGAHPDYPVSDWQIEVENHDTRLGYWDWVSNKIDID